MAEVHIYKMCVCVCLRVQFMHFMKITEKILEQMSQGICKKNRNIHRCDAAAQEEEDAKKIREMANENANV